MLNDTLRIVLVSLLSAAAGALLVTLFTSNETPSMPAATELADVDELRERVAALETALAMTDPGDDLSPGTAAPETVNSTGGQAAAADSPREQQSANRRDQRAERLNARLREAGWSDAEVDSLTALRAEVALQLEQQEYDAMRQRMEQSPDELSRWQDRQTVMREALGDDKYEQFLQAAGRPVAAEIQNVLAGSAGESAGLQPGDQVRRYGSTRVFNQLDLMVASLDGEPGEPVSIEIERDGATFHVTVPRGPLGVSRAARFGREF